MIEEIYDKFYVENKPESEAENSSHLITNPGLKRYLLERLKFCFKTMSVFSVRDAPFGQLCRLVFGPRGFLYPDTQAGFQYQQPEETPIEVPTPQANGSSTDTDADVEKAEPVSSPGQSKSGYQTISWYSEVDPENPQTCSLAKKTVKLLQICLLTFTGQLTRDFVMFFYIDQI